MNSKSAMPACSGVLKKLLRVAMDGLALNVSEVWPAAPGAVKVMLPPFCALFARLAVPTSCLPATERARSRPLPTKALTMASDSMTMFGPTALSCVAERSM